jgi:hypothetical protein
MDILEYLENALDSFESDPADTDYQHGYQAALEEIYDLLNEVP